MQINAGAKEDSVKAFAYFEKSAGVLGNHAIESAPAVSTVSLLQVIFTVNQNLTDFERKGKK